jgi:O-antigen/teichoic acid export membrane protein
MAFEVLSELYYGLMQRNNLLSRVARSRMIKGPVSALSLAVAMYITRDVLWSVAALAAVRALVWLAYDSRIRASWLSAGLARDASQGQRSIFKLLSASATLGVILMAVSLNTNMPRYFIEGIMNKHDLGIYSALASWLGAGNMLMSAVGQSAFLRIARAHVANDPATFRVLVFRTLAAASLVGLGAVATAAIAGRQMLSVLFKPEYGQYSSLFLWLMAAGAVSYLTLALGQIMTASRCFLPQVPLVLTTAGVTALACYRLVPAHGLYGAAEASLIGSCVQFAAGSGILWSWRPRGQRGRGVVERSSRVAGSGKWRAAADMEL